jgi:hypothetical protein
MYTPDMMIEKRKPHLSRARLSTEQANTLRAESGGQSVQEPDQRQPTPVHSDDEELEFDLCLAAAITDPRRIKGAGGLVTDTWKW